jgi:hypothetical protein
MLDQLTYFLHDQVNLPPYAALLIVGLVAHLALNAVLGKSPFSPWGLLGPLLLGVATHGSDLLATGLFATGFLALSLAYSLAILKLLLLPALLVVIGFMTPR